MAREKVCKYCGAPIEQSEEGWTENGVRGRMYCPDRSGRQPHVPAR